VSFIQRAREAAEAAAGQAREVAAAAGRTAGDPGTTDRLNQGLASAGKGAREAVGMAKRGVTTVIERIDPGTLAELIIKATALQEMTNTSLRTKGSPYRISEITISASIPPGVSFAIVRLSDEPEVLPDAVVSSQDLVDRADAPVGDAVLSLDGATVDEATIDALVAGSDPVSGTPRA